MTEEEKHGLYTAFVFLNQICSSEVHEFGQLSISKITFSSNPNASLDTVLYLPSLLSYL